MCLHCFHVSALIRDKVWIPTTLSVRNSTPKHICMHTSNYHVNTLTRLCKIERWYRVPAAHCSHLGKFWKLSMYLLPTEQTDTNRYTGDTRHLGDFCVGWFVALCLFFETRCPYVVQANLELCSSTSAFQGFASQTRSITGPSPCDFGLVLPVVFIPNQEPDNIKVRGNLKIS